MGNTSSSTNPSIDLINTSVITNDDIFKVDNINSYGRKHASAKLQVSNDHLCIKQKHRQSLQIPLETIKRYGLDGSIFILECGRHAPLGQARYAFRCKQACRLVNCLDQRITIRSKQLLEQQQQQQPRQDASISSSSTFTNITSITQRHHRRRRTHSLARCTLCAPSSLAIFIRGPSLYYHHLTNYSFLQVNLHPSIHSSNLRSSVQSLLRISLAISISTSSIILWRRRHRSQYPRRQRPCCIYSLSPYTRPTAVKRSSATSVSIRFRSSSAMRSPMPRCCLQSPTPGPVPSRSLPCRSSISNTTRSFM